MLTRKNGHLLMKILSTLESAGFIQELDRVKIFYDEPKFYQYRAILNYLSKFSDGRKPRRVIHSTGTSFISKHEALLKCLVESMERSSLVCFNKKNVVFANRNSLNGKAPDLRKYINYNNINSHTFGWVKGMNLTHNQSCFLPAQLAYLNFKSTYKEMPLSVTISTGAAAGFDHNETLLRGLCEVIERDAFMTTYLLKVSPPRIELARLDSKVIKQLLETVEKYRLSLFVFDVSNNIRIPTYLTLVVDESGLGPAVSTGAKTSFDPEEGITGSIAEALASRIWARSWMHKKKRLVFNFEPCSLATQLDRALFWSNRSMINKLDFLLNSKKVISPNKSQKLTTKDKLTKIYNVLNSTGYTAYYTDITLDIFRKIGALVYQTLIPGLQPLYLYEKGRIIRKDRLEQVSDYFNKKEYIINEVPHPFL